MKFLVVLAFVAILGSLGSALFFMMRGGRSQAPGTPQAPKGRMVQALALRVGLSVLLFLCILLAWKLGYLHPTGLPQGR